MTEKKENTFTCPKCSKPGNIVQYSSVNVSKSPELKKEIFNFNMFTYHCPHCGHDVMIEYPFLYHDMDNDFMIYMLTKNESDDFANEQLKDIAPYFPDDFVFRIVRGGPNSLIEKIRILEDKMDDGMVAFLKLGAVSKFEELGKKIDRIFYGGKDDTGFSYIIFNEQGTETCHFSNEEFERWCGLITFNIPKKQFVEISEFTINNYIDPNSNVIKKDNKLETKSNEDKEGISNKSHYDICHEKIYRENNLLLGKQGERLDIDDEKEWVVDGKILYKGFIKDGMPNGKGYAYNNGAKTYEGERKHGMPNGIGRIYREGKRIFGGEFVNGIAEGTGTRFDEEGTIVYEGNRKDGLPNGFGILYNEECNINYEGSWKDGLWHGNGKLYRKDVTLCYEGEFKDGLMDGEGMAYDSEGKRSRKCKFQGGKFLE